MKVINAITVLSVFIYVIAMSPSDAFLMGGARSSTITVSTIKPLTLTSAGMKSNDGKEASTRMNASSAAAATSSEDGGDSKSNEQTIAAASFNLIKGCVGSGVLSLPSGVAAIGDVPQA